MSAEVETGQEVVSDDFGIGDFFGASASTPEQEIGAIETPENTESVVVQETAMPEVTKETDSPEIVESTSNTQVQETSVTPEQDIIELRQQLAESMGQLSQLRMQIQQQPQQANKEPEMKLPENPKDLSSVDFLQGKNPTDFLESPEAFNELLNKVATVSARAGQMAGYETAMRSIPQVVQQTAQQQFNLQSAADSFYKQNQDLAPFKKAVSMAALDFYSKNPKATVEEILEGAGKATRQILRLRGTTTGRVPAQPAAAPGIGGQDRLAPQTSQLTPMEQQILDVVNAAQ